MAVLIKGSMNKFFESVTVCVYMHVHVCAISGLSV